MKHHIYADNAATTKLDKDALEAMLPFLTEEYGNPSQPYAFSRKPKKAIAEARAIIAQCINAEPEEIFFTSGGTESDNWAIKGIAANDPIKHRVIISEIEHHAILRSCQALEARNCKIEYLPVDSKGVVCLKALEDAIADDVAIVSVMLANNEIGTIEPIEDICKVAHRYGTLVHTDAVQAVGHIPIDVKKLGVDMLSASAHKFNGPKGIGFLYIKKGTQIGAYENGGAQEFGMRAGTENVPAIVGMSVALKKNCDEIAQNSQHISELETLLITNLEEAGIDFVRNGGENHIPGNISLSFRNADGEALLHRLDLMGICVSTGAACDTVNTQLSHVLKAIRLDDQYAKGTIRISLGRDNSQEEISAIVDALKRVL